MKTNIMFNHLILKFLIVIILILNTLCINAQVTNEQKDSMKFNILFSFGAGISILRNIPNDIYQDNHSNIQLGIMIEKRISKKCFAVFGVEFERLNYQLDGYLIHVNDKLQLVAAQPDIKYTKIIQNAINFPIQTRLYLRDNVNNQENIFLQTGLRIGLAINSNFSYRQNNQAFREILNKQQNRILFQYELMIGFKNNFFKKFDLLNDSTFGFMYQINPIFNKEKVNNRFRPIHLTWRFLF